MELGVCYYPEHWPETDWARDAKRMVELGISKVRIGEFAWSRLEPELGIFNWEWLHKAIDTLHAAGLQVVLGTPTACPPKWLIELYPDILAYDEQGIPKAFGSRRHYCFSSSSYRNQCSRIVTKLAQEFGEHPAIVAWQTDNEYGCHDTILSYSPDAAKAFRLWCEQQYITIEHLNKEWGNVFWSMEYSDFEDIDPPNNAVTETNPAHRLAYWRFHSDQVASFNTLQVDIIRQYSPDRDVMHNFMGNFTQFDHYQTGEALDIAGWDSYPLGFLEQSHTSDEYKRDYMRTGDPDFTAFHHDLYRGVGNGRWWVVEQQPGPVNWAPHNPAPLEGMIRLWTWEALAHGAELVSYFRYRQCPFAQEQMHAGLYLSDGSKSDAIEEVLQVSQEIASLTSVELTEQAPIALLFDYISDAALRIQPQGMSVDPLDEVLRWYKALRLLGQNIDIVGTKADLSGYSCLIIPSLTIVPNYLLSTLTELDIPILIGARSGSKTHEFSIPEQLAPGLLQMLIPLRVERVESLRSNASVAVSGQTKGEAKYWREKVRSNITPLARCEDGWGAWYKHESIHYLAAYLDDAALQGVMKTFLEEAGLAYQPVSGGLRLRTLGNLAFAFNYGPDAVDLEHEGSYVLGQAHLDVGQLAAWYQI